MLYNGQSMQGMTTSGGAYYPYSGSNTPIPSLPYNTPFTMYQMKWGAGPGSGSGTIAGRVKPPRVRFN